MPKIAEIKEIDGDVWVRVEVDVDQGSITLWTEEEKAAVTREAVEDEREACVQEAAKLGSIVLMQAIRKRSCC